jgi:site-specific DNA recombinase
MKIAIYCRTSTNLQEREQTIESQLWALRKYAKEQVWEIVKEYLDDGWSGDILARPALDKLRDAAKEGLFEAVLVVDHDRIARRFAYQAIVLDEIEEKGLQVLSLSQPKAETAEDKVLLGVRGIFAEYERIKIAERTRRGKLRKAEAGTFFGWNPPYGYRYVSEPEPHFEIVEEEAEVVKMMFQWLDEGATIRGIIRKLNELNLYPRKRRRTVWSSSTVTRLVRNEVYVGKAYYNKNYAVVPLNPKLNGKYKKVKKSSRKLRPKNEWYAIKGVPAIIDTNLFNRVQERLKQNKIFAARNRKHKYLLAGQVYCACGRKRIGEFTAGHTYYRCADRIYNFPLPQQCFLKGVNAGILDDRVWQRTVNLLSDPQFITKQAEKYLDSRTGSSPSQSEQEQITKQISKLGAEESRYLKAYGAGLMTMDKLREETKKIKKLIAGLQEKLEAKKEVEPVIDFDLSHFGAFLDEEVVKLWGFEKKQTLLRDLLLKVTIENQTRAMVKGEIPVDKQARKMGLNAESRYRWIAKFWKKYAF